MAKKGFYFSACLLLVGVVAVGAICYRQANRKNTDKMMADIATEEPQEKQKKLLHRKKQSSCRVHRWHRKARITMIKKYHNKKKILHRQSRKNGQQNEKWTDFSKHDCQKKAALKGKNKTSANDLRINCLLMKRKWFYCGR